MQGNATLHLLWIGEVIIDFLVEYVENHVQEVPTKPVYKI